MSKSMIRATRQIRRLPTRTLEGLRCFSENPSTAGSPPKFEYPKAEAMFKKITAKLDSAAEVRQFQEELMRSLGREPLDRYFYFDGFGGKGGRKKGSGDASSASAEPAAPVAVDVKLVGFDAKAKIKVIKEVRSLLGLGLKEAKELVEAAPSVLQKQVKPEAAEEVKAKLVELGAQVEIA